MKSELFHHPQNAILTLSFIAVAIVSTISADEPLRYALKAGQEFSYDVKIVADPPDIVDIMSGEIRFKVNEVDEKIKITYTGAVMKSYKEKEGYGTRFPRRRNPLSPGNYGGFYWKKNEITMSTRGQIEHVKGDLLGESQLPYYLGNLSVLPFEVFPDSDTKEWTVKTDVSIETKKSSERTLRRRYRASEEKSDKGVARQVEKYKIESESGNLVEINKSYRLIVPTSDDDLDISIEVDGTWTFNRELSVPESIDYTQKIISKQKNVKITLPISIKLQRKETKKVAAATADDPKKLRTWTDKTGNFSLEATFVKFEGDVAVLRRKDGKGEAKVRLDQLSDADRKLLESIKNK